MLSCLANLSTTLHQTAGGYHRVDGRQFLQERRGILLYARQQDGRLLPT